MWRELLRGSEWSEVVDLVSPSFFDVLKARDLQRQIRELATNYVRRERFEQARQALAEHLASSEIPVRLGSLPGSEKMETQQRGSALLQLFFHQLFCSDTALLDLRYRRFRPRDGVLCWSPKPLLVSWDASFLAALRELYAGYYDDDPAQFRAALEQLGIDRAEDIFREHFNRDHQNQVSFRLSDFRRTFHRTFVRCRDAGVTLHPNFVPLGIYLACLYEHLERLGGSHDVIQAFRAGR